MLQMVKQLLVHSNDNQNISESLDKSERVRAEKHTCSIIKVIQDDLLGNSIHTFALNDLTLKG